MGRDRFLLDSNQLELLLAFETSNGLNHLAEIMAKDPSVISRGLLKIAEAYPVLTKVRGRWEITPLGRQLNLVTKENLAKHQELLGTPTPKDNDNPIFSKNPVLIIINAQCGLLDSTQLGRNNSEAEKNIAALLAAWRKRKCPIIHVKHISDNPNSLFYRSSKGCDFLPELMPFSEETVIEKTKSSAFEKTVLAEILKVKEATDLILVGFTANECIDATARDASSLEFSTYVIADATAMFDMRTPEGKLIKADRLHRLTLINLNAFYAKVIETSSVLQFQ